jgi:hypothetical protein
MTGNAVLAAVDAATYVILSKTKKTRVLSELVGRVQLKCDGTR